MTTSHYINSKKWRKLSRKQFSALIRNHQYKKITADGLDRNACVENNGLLQWREIYRDWSIKNKPLKTTLEDVIPLDSSKWNDEAVILKVYNKAFNNPFGKILFKIAHSIECSDYWRAKRYIATIDDPEIKKILDKSINGIKPSKDNFDDEIFSMIK